MKLRKWTAEAKCDAVAWGIFAPVALAVGIALFRYLGLV